VRFERGSKIVRISAMRYRVISQPRRHFFGVRHDVYLGKPARFTQFGVSYYHNPLPLQEFDFRVESTLESTRTLQTQKSLRPGRKTADEGAHLRRRDCCC
jgi:hypothetical protein